MIFMAAVRVETKSLSVFLSSMEKLVPDFAKKVLQEEFVMMITLDEGMSSDKEIIILYKRPG